MVVMIYNCYFVFKVNLKSWKDKFYCFDIDYILFICYIYWILKDKYFGWFKLLVNFS